MDHLLRYACLIRMNSHPIRGALLSLATRPLHRLKRAPPSSKLARRILFSLLPSASLHELAPCIYGVPFSVWLTGSTSYFASSRDSEVLRTDQLYDDVFHHLKRAPPSNSKMSCKPSFPTRPPPLCLSPTFPTALCSLSCPHRSHSVPRDTHLHAYEEMHISLSWRIPLLGHQFQRTTRVAHQHPGHFRSCRNHAHEKGACDSGVGKRCSHCQEEDFAL